MALAYAPASARPAWAALLALDLRLAGIVRSVHEPLLAQVRLAWWRDRLGEDCANWPAGEPVLQALRGWNGHYAGLIALVDGWEELLGEAPLPSASLAALAEGRAQAFVALSRALGEEASIGATHALGLRWALADLAGHLSHPQEIAAVRALLEASDAKVSRLPRSLRPLPVLHALATRDGGRAILVAMRLGLFGR